MVKKTTPDLVLIDGRFRVFCFLTAIKLAPFGTKILYDDYTNRPFNHEVEDFYQKIDVCGRQALFEVSSRATGKVTDDILATFQNFVN